jgi:hypothetical protein
MRDEGRAVGCQLAERQNEHCRDAARPRSCRYCWRELLHMTCTGFCCCHGLLVPLLLIRAVLPPAASLSLQVCCDVLLVLQFVGCCCCLLLLLLLLLAAANVPHRSTRPVGVPPTHLDDGGVAEGDCDIPCVRVLRHCQLVVGHGRASRAPRWAAPAATPSPRAMAA